MLHVPTQGRYPARADGEMPTRRHVFRFRWYRCEYCGRRNLYLSPRRALRAGWVATANGSGFAWHCERCADTAELGVCDA